MTLYLRYLVMADKDYHYRLTTEGLIVTYQEAIPEMAYTIVRGLAWLAMAICVMAVSVLGPLALVGAGGMALLRYFSLTLNVKCQSMRPCLKKTAIIHCLSPIKKCTEIRIDTF